MTARGAVSRQKGCGGPAVILAELSRPAEGGTTEFGGNPEEQRQPPDDPPLWIKLEQAGDGLEYRGKSEHNTLFYWIPPATRGQARE